MGSFLVCKVLPDPRSFFAKTFFKKKQTNFELVVVLDSETWFEEVDAANGESHTLIRAKATNKTLNVKGEFCGAFPTANEAYAFMEQLDVIYEVMES